MKLTTRFYVTSSLVLSALAIVSATACSSSSTATSGDATADAGDATTKAGIDSGKTGVDGQSPADAGSMSNVDATMSSTIEDSGSSFVYLDLDAPIGEDGEVTGDHATVRVADFSKPFLLYLDVCFSTDPISSTTHWEGPLLRGRYESISNSVVSPYLDVAPGTQSIRFVLANSDCDETLEGIPDYPIPTPLAKGTYTSLVLAGTAYDAGARPMQLFEYADTVAPANGPNSVRFINVAQAESAVDIYAYSGYGGKLPCTLMYSDIAYGGVGEATKIPGDGGPTASNGYTPLRGANLYDLTFQNYTLSLTDHDAPTTGDGGACNHGFQGMYTTDYYLGSGAWTVFIYDDNFGHVYIRDDGTPFELQTPH